MLKLISVLFLIKILTSCSVQSCSDKLRESKIIPEILDDFETEQVLNVTYLQPIECGTQLTPNEVRMLPDVDWDAKSDELYTLFMVDCGAIGGNMMEVKHWLVMNIPGNDIGKGDTAIEYIGAMPPKVSVN